MPELGNVIKQKTAGFVNPSYSRTKRQAKMEQEEKELEALMKGEKDDPEKESVEKELGAETKGSEGTDKASKDESLSAEESTFKKRYGDLRRHSQAEAKELRDKIESLEKRMSSGATIVAPKSDEDIQEWSAKYPEVAGIVETIARKQAQEMFDSTDTRLKALDDERNQFNRSKAEDDIRKAHPDFDTLRNDDTFHEWVDEQPKWIQDALYENESDAKAVTRVLDLFKVDTQPKTPSAPERTQAKAAASSVKTKTARSAPDSDGKPTFKESQIKAASDSWFEKNLVAIEEAMRDGRFIYDLSK